jgi:hypothetical protein
MRHGTVLALLLLIPVASLGRPMDLAHAGAPVRCTTYEEKTLHRLHTLCDDGTRGVSTYNQVLGRWETLITPPPGQRCTGPLNPKIRPWEGRCR